MGSVYFGTEDGCAKYIMLLWLGRNKRQRGKEARQEKTQSKGRSEEGSFTSPGTADKVQDDGAEIKHTNE